MNPGIVQLGRLGDIVNVLPIAWELEGQGHRCHWMVQECYAPMMEGVTYLDPVLWTGDIEDVPGAAGELARNHSPILVTQTYGRRGFKRQSESFAREAWRLAGFDDLWDSLPLIFDNRSESREAALVKRYAPDDAPLILTATSGHSSPFGEWNLFFGEIEKRWGGQCRIVDLTPIRAERPYDLLGLMDKAAILISVDTMPLHLGYASRVPTVGLVADGPTPWHGTAMRKHWMARVPYRQWRDSMKHVHLCVERAVARKELDRQTAGLESPRSQPCTGGRGAPLAKTA